MLNKSIETWYHNRLWTAVVFGLLALAGLIALSGIPIDAVPDITNVQVVVNTKTGALDPGQVEKSVSFPIESEMGGLPGLKEARSLSKYGLSQVVLVFEDGTDIYWARQQVGERLSDARESLPQGLSPELAPISTGLGEVFMYTLRAKPGSALAQQDEKTRLLALRTAQDLVIRPRLKTLVKGIADIDSTGGYKKEIHIDVDPGSLERHGLSLSELIARLETLGESFGGGYVEQEGKQVIVRTQGALDSLDDIRQLALKTGFGGEAVRVADVAVVREDPVQRLGAATVAGEQAVLGTVLMFTGANSRQVALDSEKALKEMVLPPDMEAVALYSRRSLVEGTVHTVTRSLLEGAALVVLVLLLLLGHWRAAVLVSMAIPISMLMAALGMRFFGISANLMSLGAIDFGLLVDASVVIIENVIRRMEERKQADAKERLVLVLDAVREVSGPVLLGLLMIMAVYVPILALQGIEGKIFKPMGQTVLMALGSSLVVALFLMPALAYLVIKKAPAHHSRFFNAIRNLYVPLFNWTLRRQRLVLVGLGVFAVLSMAAFHRLGADFLPQLDEGDLVINFERDASISLSDSIKMQEQSEKIIDTFPEVEAVFGRIGTAESATDPMGVHLADTFITLKKPRSVWPKQANGRRRSKDELFVAIKAAVDAKVKDQELIQSQPIELRFNEILEGSRADVSLRIYGPDLEVLGGLLEKSKEVVETVPGAAEVELDALTALRKSPVLSLVPSQGNLARYRVSLAELNHTVEAAMGGKEVGSLYQGPWRFPVIVRLEESLREDASMITRLPVALPEGGTIPLGYLAKVERRDQVTTIAHQGGERYAGVAVYLGGRDTESFVREAQAAMAEKVKLPEGYRLEWGGQFKNLQAARARLRLLVPLVLLALFVTLVRSFGSLRQAVLVFSSIPFAMTGGALALFVRGIPFSISAAVGFIALTGIAILNTMVLVTFFNQLRAQGRNLADSVREGTLGRLRPVLMTALVASLGFLPMALNTGLGAEVQRPLATVVIGGLLSSTFLTLLVLPMLYLWVEGQAQARHLRHDAAPLDATKVTLGRRKRRA